MAKRHKQEVYAVCLHDSGRVDEVGPYRDREEAAIYGTPRLKMGSPRYVAMIRATSGAAAARAAAEEWTDRMVCADCGRKTQPEEDERGVYADCIEHGPARLVRP